MNKRHYEHTLPNIRGSLSNTYYYETKPEFATLYNTLWEQAGQYAVENLKDDELSYYYEVTD